MLFASPLTLRDESPNGEWRMAREGFEAAVSFFELGPLRGLERTDCCVAEKVSAYRGGAGGGRTIGGWCDVPPVCRCSWVIEFLVLLRPPQRASFGAQVSEWGEGGIVECRWWQRGLHAFAVVLARFELRHITRLGPRIFVGL